MYSISDERGFANASSARAWVFSDKKTSGITFLMQRDESYRIAFAKYVKSGIWILHLEREIREAVLGISVRSELKRARSFMDSIGSNKLCIRTDEECLNMSIHSINNRNNFGSSFDGDFGLDRDHRNEPCDKPSFLDRISGSVNGERTDVHVVNEFAFSGKSVKLRGNQEKGKRSLRSFVSVPGRLFGSISFKSKASKKHRSGEEENENGSEAVAGRESASCRWRGSLKGFAPSRKIGAALSFVISRMHRAIDSALDSALKDIDTADVSDQNYCFDFELAQNDSSYLDIDTETVFSGKQMVWLLLAFLHPLFLESRMYKLWQNKTIAATAYDEMDAFSSRDEQDVVSLQDAGDSLQARQQLQRMEDLIVGAAAAVDESQIVRLLGAPDHWLESIRAAFDDLQEIALIVVDVRAPKSERETENNIARRGRKRTMTSQRSSSSFSLSFRKDPSTTENATPLGNDRSCASSSSMGPPTGAHAHTPKRSGIKGALPALSSDAEVQRPSSTQHSSMRSAGSAASSPRQCSSPSHRAQQRQSQTERHTEKQRVGLGENLTERRFPVVFANKHAGRLHAQGQAYVEALACEWEELRAEDISEASRPRSYDSDADPDADAALGSDVCAHEQYDSGHSPETQAEKREEEMNEEVSWSRSSRRSLRKHSARSSSTWSVRMRSRSHSRSLPDYRRVLPTSSCEAFSFDQSVLGFGRAETMSLRVGSDAVETVFSEGDDDGNVGNWRNGGFGVSQGGGVGGTGVAGLRVNTVSTIDEAENSRGAGISAPTAAVTAAGGDDDDDGVGMMDGTKERVIAVSSSRRRRTQSLDSSSNGSNGSKKGWGHVPLNPSDTVTATATATDAAAAALTTSSSNATTSKSSSGKNNNNNCCSSSSSRASSGKSKATICAVRKRFTARRRRTSAPELAGRDFFHALHAESLLMCACGCSAAAGEHRASKTTIESGLWKAAGTDTDSEDSESASSDDDGEGDGDDDVLLDAELAPEREEVRKNEEERRTEKDARRRERLLRRQLRAFVRQETEQVEEGQRQIETALAAGTPLQLVLTRRCASASNWSLRAKKGGEIRGGRGGGKRGGRRDSGSASAVCAAAEAAVEGRGVRSRARPESGAGKKTRRRPSLASLSSIGSVRSVKSGRSSAGGSSPRSARFSRNPSSPISHAPSPNPFLLDLRSASSSGAVLTSLTTGSSAAMRSKRQLRFSIDESSTQGEGQGEFDDASVFSTFSSVQSVDLDGETWPSTATTPVTATGATITNTASAASVFTSVKLAKRMSYSTVQENSIISCSGLGVPISLPSDTDHCCEEAAAHLATGQKDQNIQIGEESAEGAEEMEGSVGDKAALRGRGGAGTLSSSFSHSFCISPSTDPDPDQMHTRKGHVGQTRDYRTGQVSNSGVSGKSAKSGKLLGFGGMSGKFSVLGSGKWVSQQGKAAHSYLWGSARERAGRQAGQRKRAKDLLREKEANERVRRGAVRRQRLEQELRLMQAPRDSLLLTLRPIFSRSTGEYIYMAAALVQLPPRRARMNAVQRETQTEMQREITMDDPYLPQTLSQQQLSPDCVSGQEEGAGRYMNDEVTNLAIRSATDRPSAQVLSISVPGSSSGRAATPTTPTCDSVCAAATTPTSPLSASASPSLSLRAGAPLARLNGRRLSRQLSTPRSSAALSPSRLPLVTVQEHAGFFGEAARESASTSRSDSASIYGTGASRSASASHSGSGSEKHVYTLPAHAESIIDSHEHTHSPAAAVTERAQSKLDHHADDVLDLTCRRDVVSAEDMGAHTNTYAFNGISSSSSGGGHAGEKSELELRAFSSSESVAPPNGRNTALLPHLASSLTLQLALSTPKADICSPYSDSGASGATEREDDDEEKELPAHTRPCLPYMSRSPLNLPSTLTPLTPLTSHTPRTLGTVHTLLPNKISGISMDSVLGLNDSSKTQQGNASDGVYHITADKSGGGEEVERRLEDDSERWRGANEEKIQDQEVEQTEGVPEEVQQNVSDVLSFLATIASAH